MELTNSTTINNFKTGEVCTLVLKFTDFAEKENVHTFFVNCKSSDGYKVVCFGRMNWETTELSKLNTNDILLVKNVVTGERRPRVGGVSHDFKIASDSEIHLLCNGHFCEIFPSQKTAAQSSKSVTFSNDLTVIEIPEVALVSHSKNFEHVDIDGMCTITLKIESYVPKKIYNLIFINCKTLDNVSVTVEALLYRHTEEMKKNDIVQFVDVKRISLKDGVYILRFCNDSHAILYYRNGYNYDVPKELLNGEDNELEALPGNDNDSRKVNGQKYLLLPDLSGDNLVDRYNIIQKSELLCMKSECEKVTGTLTSKFEDDEHRQTKVPIYTANLLLDNEIEIKLLLDADFANWPLQFLRKGHRVSVGGKNEKYLGRDARHVNKGDDFDYLPEVNSFKQA